MKKQLWVMAEDGQRDFARLNARRFKKDVIRVGTWKLADGRQLVANRRNMDQWVATFKAMRAAGIRIPFPVDHSNASTDNQGWVDDLMREGNTLYCVVDVPREEDAARLGKTIKEVSISVTPDYTDGTGRKWGECVRHIAPCTIPVVPGQDDFIPLDARGEKIDVYHLRKETPEMDWRERLTKALNLSAEEAKALSDEQIAAKLDAMAESESKHTELLRSTKDARDKAMQNTAALRAEIDTLKKQVPASEPPESEREKQMRQRLERIVAEGAAAKVAQLRSEGKLLPAMEPAVRELLSRGAEMDLRAGDKDTDVAALVEGIFASLPKGAALDLTERTKNFSEVPNPNENAGLTEADQVKLGEQAAKAAQGLPD